jgi:transcriptional antiterminator Rof (Rho-off)
MVEVDLKPDSCASYAFWSMWLRSNIAAAVVLGDKDVLNSTAKNLRNRAKRKYYCIEIDMAERNKRLDEIYAINTSMAVRQGREMSEGYREYPKAMTGGDRCDKHYDRWFGVFEVESDRMVGYLVGNVVGRMGGISMILGHGDYLKDGIMYYLVDTWYRYCKRKDVCLCVYGRWDSGSDGLRVFKHNVGMREMDVRIE